MLDIEDNFPGEPLTYSIPMGKSGWQISTCDNELLKFTTQFANL